MFNLIHGCKFITGVGVPPLINQRIDTLDRVLSFYAALRWICAYNPYYIKHVRCGKRKFGLYFKIISKSYCLLFDFTVLSKRNLNRGYVIPVVLHGDDSDLVKGDCTHDRSTDRLDGYKFDARRGGPNAPLPSACFSP